MVFCVLKSARALSEGDVTDGSAVLVLSSFDAEFWSVFSVMFEEGVVFRPEDYKYSSAVDYSGERGLLEDICVFQFFKL